MLSIHEVFNYRAKAPPAPFCPVVQESIGFHECKVCLLYMHRQMLFCFHCGALFCIRDIIQFSETSDSDGREDLTCPNCRDWTSSNSVGVCLPTSAEKHYMDNNMIFACNRCWFKDNYYQAIAHTTCGETQWKRAPHIQDPEPTFQAAYQISSNLDVQAGSHREDVLIDDLVDPTYVPKEAVAKEVDPDADADTDSASEAGADISSVGSEIMNAIDNLVDVHPASPGMPILSDHSNALEEDSYPFDDTSPPVLVEMPATSPLSPGRTSPAPQVQQ